MNLAQMTSIENAIDTLSVQFHLPAVRRRRLVHLQLAIVAYSKTISGTEGARLGLRVLRRIWLVLRHR